MALAPNMIMLGRKPETKFMAYKARFWKKIRKWLGKKMDLQSRETYGRNVLATQLADLLKSRGSEVITMTTL